jgi:hypothetical protein
MTTITAIDDRKAIPTTPPANWQREIPKYRVTRETHPAPKARFRTEPPFASGSESDVWQYGDRTLKAGDIVETKEWPHSLFFPLNYSAKRVLDFFNSQMKSRMARSPFFGNEIRLETGLSGGPPQIAAPQVQPVGVQPAGGWPRR